MSKWFVLLAMLFCLIVDDYYLQGWLASAKQKDWWQKNAPEDLYKHDYIMALAMHGMSWAFMVMLPVATYNGFDVSPLFVGVFALNALVHCFIDNAKANWGVINLITDQLTHIAQIVAIWLALVK